MLILTEKWPLKNKRSLLFFLLLFSVIVLINLQIVVLFTFIFPVSRDLADVLTQWHYDNGCTMFGKNTYYMYEAVGNEICSCHFPLPFTILLGVDLDNLVLLRESELNCNRKIM